MSQRIRFLTRTACFLALLIAAHWGTGLLNNQILTGSVVNLILVTAAFIVGLPGGLVVALVSPTLAFLVGLGPKFPQILPVISVGNAVIVLLTWLLAGRGGTGPIWRRAAAVVLGAAGKCLFLWVGIVKIAVALMPALPAAIAVMFSFPQLITGLIGGGGAFLILPVLQKAIRSDVSKV